MNQDWPKGDENFPHWGRCKPKPWFREDPLAECPRQVQLGSLLQCYSELAFPGVSRISLSCPLISRAHWSIRMSCGTITGIVHSSFILTL